MLLTKTVKIKWNPANKKHYETKGYKWTKKGDEFEVKVEDLTQGQSDKIQIQAQCDNPNCSHPIIPITYKCYLKNINKHEGEFICYDCIRQGLYKYDTYGNKITINDKGRRICNVNNCNNVYFSKGYCKYHYSKLYENHDKCIVEGCTDNSDAKGYCRNHYKIFKRFGYIPSRNRYDELEVIEHKNYAEIILYNKYYVPHAYTQIDLEDVEKVKQYKWRLSSQGYVCGWIENNTKTIFLHRFLMDAPRNKVVHHKNHIITDNRKKNLTLCSHLENSFDKNNLEKYNKSGCVGVFFVERNTIHPWRAYLSEKILEEIDNNKGYIGSFKTYDEAVYAREIYELYYYKNFSPKFNELKNKYQYIYNDLIENGVERYIHIN